MSRVAAFKPVPQPAVDAVEEIFQEHYRLVYRTAYTVTGNAQDAEDVLQKVFLQLVRRGIPAGLCKNPEGYLYRAAVNQALNAVRSRRRRGEVFDPVLLERAIEVPIYDDPNASGDIQQRLLAALATLSERAIAMVVLRYEQQYSEHAIAKIFNTSPSVVAVTLWRARARLRKLLSPTDVRR